MKKIFFLSILCCLFFISCAHKHNHDADTEQKNNNTEHPGAISFTQVQAGKIDFATERPLSEPLGQVIKTTAQIVSDQTDEKIIVARTAGIVMFSGKTVVEGKAVSSEQELFSISGTGMAENSIDVRLAEIRSNYQKAEADYLRAQELAKDKIVSDKEFLKIKNDYETTKAVYDNLYKNFSGKGQQVSSPMTGFVKQVFVSNGQFVQEGQALISISKNKSLLLKADVPSRYSYLLPFIFSANICKPNDSITYTLEELNGRILSFGHSVNDNNYMIPVNFQIDNKAGFIPGSFVEMFIKTKSEKAVLSLPKEALIENQGSFFVFVRIEPELFEKREVKTGISDGIRTQIISGINGNEEVVTKGAMFVRLAESAGTLDPHAGHVH